MPGAEGIFVRDQAKMQMLGVEAAIHGYRWEHQALPETLDLMKLGKLAQDPFTGKLLQYKVTGPTTYELSGEEIAGVSKAP